jgi:hypothetical protein
MTDCRSNQCSNAIKPSKIPKLPNAKSFNLPQLAYFANELMYKAIVAECFEAPPNCSLSHRSCTLFLCSCDELVRICTLGVR